MNVDTTAANEWPTTNPSETTTTQVTNNCDPFEPTERGWRVDTQLSYKVNRRSIMMEDNPEEGIKCFAAEFQDALIQIKELVGCVHEGSLGAYPLVSRRRFIVNERVFERQILHETGWKSCVIRGPYIPEELRKEERCCEEFFALIKRVSPRLVLKAVWSRAEKIGVFPSDLIKCEMAEKVIANCAPAIAAALGETLYQ